MQFHILFTNITKMLWAAVKNHLAKKISNRCKLLSLSLPYI